MIDGGSVLAQNEQKMRPPRRASRRLAARAHREFATFRDAVGPALRDALVACVKAHGFFAVRMMVAE
jgi:hypothetical protein